MARRAASGGVTAASAGPERRQLLALLLGLDLALLLLHLGTEAALAAAGTRFGAASADHALLGAAAPLQLLAVVAAALAARATGPPDYRAAVAVGLLALADAADLTSRLALPLAAAVEPLDVPAAKLAVAVAVVGPVVALLLAPPGGPGPLGRAVLRLTVGLALAGFVSESVTLFLTPGGAAARVVLDGLEEFAEAAVASWTLMTACGRSNARGGLIIPIRDERTALS